MIGSGGAALFSQHICPHSGGRKRRKGRGASRASRCSQEGKIQVKHFTAASRQVIRMIIDVLDRSSLDTCFTSNQHDLPRGPIAEQLVASYNPARSHARRLSAISFASSPKAHVSFPSARSSVQRSDLAGAAVTCHPCACPTHFLLCVPSPCIPTSSAATSSFSLLCRACSCWPSAARSALYSIIQPSTCRSLTTASSASAPSSTLICAASKPTSPSTSMQVREGRVRACDGDGKA